MMRSSPRYASIALAASSLLLATPAPAMADPPADMAVLFSDLCVTPALSIEGLKTAFARVTHGEAPLDGLVTDRQQIYSREIALGDVTYTLQALAHAGSPSFRNCKLSAEFPRVETVEVHLDRLFPAARRTQPDVRRTTVGSSQLFIISAQWLAPTPHIGFINLTVEAFHKRHKATLTAVPAVP